MENPPNCKLRDSSPGRGFATDLHDVCASVFQFLEFSNFLGQTLVTTFISILRWTPFSQLLIVQTLMLRAVNV